MIKKSLAYGWIWKFVLWLVLVFFLFVGTTFWFLFARLKNNLPVLSSFPLDDAFIHLTYARSLISEHCPCFNPGVPEAGMTSPLWVLFLSLAYAITKSTGLNPIMSAKFLSALFGLLSAVVVIPMLRGKNQTGFDLPLALIVSSLLLIDPHLNFSRVAGMEVTMSAFFILLTIFSWVRQKPLWLGITVSLSILTRPENSLLLGLSLIGILVQVLRKKQKPSAIFWLLFPSLILVGLWALYNYSISGRPLPNTYYAKTIPFNWFRFETFWNLVRYDVLGLAEFQRGFGLVFYLIGIIYLLARRRELWPLVLYPWIYLYGLSLTRTFYSYQGYYFTRYFQPIIPCLLIPLGIGLLSSFRALWGKRGKFGVTIGLVLWTLVLIGFLGQIPSTLDAQRRLLAQDCTHILRIHIRTGKWIRENLPKDAIVAAYDVGALRFYGNHTIVDLNGLNTHQMLDSPLYLEQVKPTHYFLPMFRREARQISPNIWTRYRVKGDFYVLLRPIFFASSFQYAIPGHPALQVLMEAKYLEK